MNADPSERPIAEVGQAGFDLAVLQSKVPVLVVFWAPWSRPCQILDSVLGDVAAECAEGVRVVKVNADDNPDLSMLYDIQSVPTLLCFLGGSLLARVVGTVSKEAIHAKLRAVCRETDATSRAEENHVRSRVLPGNQEKTA